MSEIVGEKHHELGAAVYYLRYVFLVAVISVAFMVILAAISGCISVYVQLK